MISPFNPTGASCLIPPPNREPMPAAIITNVVLILFLLFFSFFKLTSKNCKEAWSPLIFRTKSFYKSLKLLFRIHKMIRCILTICSWSANCYKLYSLITNRSVQFSFLILPDAFHELFLTQNNHVHHDLLLSNNTLLSSSLNSCLFRINPFSYFSRITFTRIFYLCYHRYAELSRH